MIMMVIAFVLMAISWRVVMIDVIVGVVGMGAHCDVPFACLPQVALDDVDEFLGSV